MRPFSVVKLGHLSWKKTVDGLGVCRVVRAGGMRVPILMLTARVELDARVAGLDAGADDYLANPFELEDLLARLRALLRRAPTEPSSPDGQIPCGGVCAIDTESRRLDPDGIHRDPAVTTH